MADVVVDAGALGVIASHARSAVTPMTWDLHAAGLDVMGDGDVADAVARVTQERRARVEVVGDGIRVVASHPAVVSAGFDEQDERLGRSLQ